MGFTFEEFPNADYYKSDLRKILKYVRSIEKYIAELDGVIEELQEGLKRLDGIEADVTYLKQCCSEVKETISIIQADISALDTVTQDLLVRVDTLEAQVTNLYEYIDAKIAELLAIHNEDFYLLSLKLNQAKEQLQAEIDELRERLDQIDTNVYNPWIGERVTQQENEDYTYNHLADECLTADQYSSLDLTADEYAELGITANDYCEFGKDKLHWNWVYSPAYGWRQEINNVLTSIVDFLAGTMSASEYAELELTADEYAQLELSSEQYFRYNPFVPEGYVKVDPNGIGLTVEQYSHLQTV